MKSVITYASVSPFVTTDPEASVRVLIQIGIPVKWLDWETCELSGFCHIDPLEHPDSDETEENEEDEVTTPLPPVQFARCRIVPATISRLTNPPTVVVEIHKKQVRPCTYEKYFSGHFFFVAAVYQFPGWLSRRLNLEQSIQLEPGYYKLYKSKQSIILFIDIPSI